VYSQAVLLALVRAGRTRDEAYRLVQAASQQASETGRHLREVLEADPASGLDPAVLDRCFDPAAHLGRAGAAFERLAVVGLG
ncbi:MAG: adenylosuccinate lyase, partial [Gemmatimonadetes bacterium]|nr:adenylosuccinate lyase [Gemmatimonadota bacterium]